MATVACMSCGLPRSEELIDAACPVCGQRGTEKPQPVAEPEPLHDKPWVISEPAKPPEVSRGRGELAGPVNGFVLGVACSLLAVSLWPALEGNFRVTGETASVTVQPAAPIQEVSIAPLPREVVTSLRPESPPVETIEIRPEPPRDALGPMPEAAPRNPFRPEAPRALLLDHAQHYSPLVPPGSTVTVRGWVKSLVIRDLEAGAVLDCSQLDAEEVTVIGKIDNGSRLLLRAPGGTVVFRSKVDGRSRVEVKAPGGSVLFAPPGMGQDDSKIDGNSAVEITARTVTFRGRIHGAGTRIHVTLTSNASLQFAEIAGGARLEYSKLDPDDTNPTITPGRIESGKFGPLD